MFRPSSKRATRPLAVFVWSRAPPKRRSCPPHRSSSKRDHSSPRIGQSPTAAVGVFARPLSDRASLQNLVGYTESRPIAERPAGPNATVGRERNHYRHRVKQWPRWQSPKGRRLLGVGGGDKQRRDQDRSGKRHHCPLPCTDTRMREVDDITAKQAAAARRIVGADLWPAPGSA
jgi:hypothetical protein